ncbi:hypothetical protein JCM8097_001836 [Rhodosporidiobolus ruineniae]
MPKPAAAGYSTASIAPTPLPSSSSPPDHDPLNDPEAPPPVSDPFTSSGISIAQTEPVFTLIQRCKHEVDTAVDSALSWDQLRTPAINFSLVRPLTNKLSSGGRPAPALIFALLVSRAHFVERAEDDLAFAAVNTSRADLCELLATKLLSLFSTPSGSLELLHVLTTPFNAFGGATVDMFPPEEGVDADELERLVEWGKEEEANALELGIFSGAKRFVKSPLVQRVIKAVHEGEVIYSPESNHALLQDSYKAKPVVEVYDWRRRPFLDHHRLRVPRIRTRLEFMAFEIMLGLFLATQATYSPSSLNIWELLFIFWGIGFALDEYVAIQENGIGAYLGGPFNVLDSVFVLVFAAYLAMRLVALHKADEALSVLALDTLSLGGCVLLPRITVSLLKDNIVLLALSKMVKEFVVFMFLTVLTASGFLVTLRILSHGRWDVGHISWLLLRMHLGSAFMGFDVAQDFHPIYGPTLMVSFAVLSQTLLLTILISLLTNTFSQVQANAETEILYQKALQTVERAKADPLTLYVSPMNTVALVALFPLRYLASPYVFHKSQVYLARALNLPVLLFLALSVRLSSSRRSALSGSGLYLPLARTSSRASDRPHKDKGTFARSLAARLSLTSQAAQGWWDGSVDVLADKVFEREVNSEGRRVASMDEAASPALEEEETEGGKGKGKQRAAPPAPLAGLSPASPSPSPLRRTDTAAGHERLGSLTSPLARIFGASASSAVLAGKKPSAADDEGVKERLDRIEEALRVLLGEVGRGKKAGGDDDEGGAEGPPKPLVSLTGEVEPSYAD